MALYSVSADDCIVWDPTDDYDWFDFTHLYPSYYDRYTLNPEGIPEKDVPIGFTGLTSNARPSAAHAVPTRRNAAKSSRPHHR